MLLACARDDTVAREATIARAAIMSQINAGAAAMRDKNVDAYGGVPIPKVTYQLPDGRKFYIDVDKSELQTMFDRTVQLPEEKHEEPWENDGPEVGWGKNWGILRSGSRARRGSGISVQTRRSTRPRRSVSRCAPGRRWRRGGFRIG